MVMESPSGVRGENSVKIIGPDLAELERAADRVWATLQTDPTVWRTSASTASWASRTSCFRVDPHKCCAGGTSRRPTCRAVIDTAVGGRPFSQMIEGERSFDITLRWPEASGERN